MSNIDLFQNCVLYLPLNGNTSDYAKQQTVTQYNSPTFTTLSSGRKALTLNGSNQYISIPDASAMELGSNNFTIFLWFNTNSLSVTQGLLSKRTADDYASPIVILFDYSTGYLKLLLSSTGADYLLNENVYAMSNLLTSTFYCLCFVRNGSYIYGYLYGRLIYTSSSISTSSLYNNSNPWLIGCSYTAGNTFDGMLKNQIILNGTALSQAQINLLMDLTNPTRPNEFFPIINGIRGCY